MNRKKENPGLNRRDFLKGSVVGLLGWPLLKYAGPLTAGSGPKTRLALVRTDDRRQGIKKALALLDFESPVGKDVLVKPNFNTADPPPASTHNDTLAQVVAELKQRGAKDILVGDRCGPAKMDEVLKEKGIPELAETAGFKVMDFETLPGSDWLPFNHPELHWENGFSIPRPVKEADYIVLTPCLKTHQYGGVFTMSLKLSVGLTPRSLMRQLHRSEHMRKMIAEINLAYTPKLIVLDGVTCFVDGGPMKGKAAKANVILAGTDRVAVDAVGLAVLKEQGSNSAIMETKIFQQEQIARAVELGLGNGDPTRIELLTSDAESRTYARILKKILARG